MISNIANLQGFKSLKILSLGRNAIKHLQGIEAASESLEQLWVSYNQVRFVNFCSTHQRGKLKIKILKQWGNV